ncbi:DMT family transporter [Marinivivus vitaminiproducens]|uniref:DMT family transporter n=1 Tax=Marinivivus vitaminiproducens TaxID=3035935 RepID=UPI0027A3AAA7|nr:DMT family transporter [Geminicoccaceae bacterium SCSIO 64248]
MSRPASHDVTPLALCLMAGVTLFWGLNWPLMKLALADVPPWAFRAACVACGAVGLLTMAKMGGHALTIPRRLWPMLLLTGLLNITGWHLFTAFGLLSVGGGRASILAFTQPIWVTLFSLIYLSERPTQRHWLGLACGMAGMLVLLVPDLTRLGGEPLGTLLILCGAVSWASGTLLTKVTDWDTPLFTLLGWQMTIGGLPIILGWIVIEDAWLRPQDVGLLPALATLYAVSIPMVFCYWAFFRIVQLLPASIASLSVLATPVVGLFSAALLLGEPVGLGEVAALVLVMLALFFVLRPARAPAPAPAEAAELPSQG